jgi:hypothetical protein
MNDPEFFEDAHRSVLEILDPLSCQDVTGIVQQLYATAPEIIRRYPASGSATNSDKEVRNEESD